MYSSNVLTPSSSRFILVHEWQILFCQDNHCAAFLLAFFVNCHDHKINHQTHTSSITSRENDSFMHEKKHNLCMSFQMEDFELELLGLFDRATIRASLELLQTLQVIKVHKLDDKEIHYQFFPEVCNQWLQGGDV